MQGRVLCCGVLKTPWFVAAQSDHRATETGRMRMMQRMMKVFSQETLVVCNLFVLCADEIQGA